MIGDLPKDWRIDRLKYLATLNDEVLPETTSPDYELQYVDISSVDPVEGITKYENFRFESAPSRARRIVRDGDVILSTVRTYLRAIAAIRKPDPNTIVSTGFAVIRPRELDTAFAAYALSAPYFIGQVLAESAGVSYPAITPQALSCIGVAYPSRSDQQAIAAFVDRETAKIDALVAKKRRLIELIEAKRVAVITEAVTRGIVQNAVTRDSGVAWIGAIPAHWAIKRLWHLTPPDRRIMYGIVLPGPNVENGVPIVKGGDVAASRLRLDALSRTTHEIEASYARSRLRGGDLVFAIRGSIGEVAMVPDELEGANVTQDAARVAPAAGVDGRWLLYALRSTCVFAQLESGALGATIKGINIRDLKRALLPVPPPEEQAAIAEVLDAQNERLDRLERRIGDGINCLLELRSSLISAAITGKIDVRGEAP